jgi:hypothetical protein
MLRGFFRSLYWKLSAVFLILLTFVGAAYIVLTFTSSGEYFAEANQRINASLAQHIVDDIELFPNGKPNLEAMNTLFHNVMVVNPSVEVYLLDAEGKILTFDASSSHPFRLSRSTSFWRPTERSIFWATTRATFTNRKYFLSPQRK